MIQSVGEAVTTIALFSLSAVIFTSEEKSSSCDSGAPSLPENLDFFELLPETSELSVFARVSESPWFR